MDTKITETEAANAETIETIQDETLVTATGGNHCFPVAYAMPMAYARPVAYAAPAYYASPVAYAAPAYYARPVAYAMPVRWR